MYLTKSDIERLAGFFHQPAGAFARTYTRIIKGRRALKNRPDSSDCIFLANKACTVYDGRPTQCRTYPWWLVNIVDAESWQEAAQVCEGIDHPTAQPIPASEILEQCLIDVKNDEELNPR